MLAATIFFSILLIIWVAFPLIRTGGSGQSVKDSLAAEREQSLVDALQKLQAGREEGKVSDADFDNIEKGLMLELAKIYHTEGVDPSRGKDKDTETPPEEKAGPTCPNCGYIGETGDKFCASCGTGFEAA
jgi:hypothetical protein